MAVQVKVTALGNDVVQSSAFTVVDELVITQPSQVLLNLAPEDIASMRREGDDLIIELANGETLELIGFYDYSVDENQSELFLTGDDDQFIPLELTTLSDGTIAYTPYFPAGELSGFEVAETAAATDGGAFGGVGFVPVALGGAALAGLALAAGGSSSSSSNPGDNTEDGVGDPVDPGDSGDPDDPDDPDDNEETPGGEIIIDPPTVALETDTGSVVGLTSDGTVLVGNLIDGAIWEYSLNGGVSWLQGEGSSFELAEGIYPSGSVVVRQSDGTDNVSDTASLGSVTVDMTPPLSPILTFENDTGDTAGVTADGTLIVTQLEPNTIWEFSLDGGATWQQGVGDRFVLPEGDYVQGQVQARQTDGAGNISEVAEFDAVTVDLVIDDPIDPELPVIPTLTLANDTGSEDGITSDGTVLVDNLEDNASWEYSLDAGVSWLQGSGSSFELAEGIYPAGQVLVRQTDAAGNTSGTSTLGSVTVDATSPESPVLALANDTGLEDGITTDGSVQVSNLEAGALWEYSLDGGATWLRGAGDRFVLAEGEYVAGQVQARQIDAAGNISDISQLGAITVDLDADIPAEPGIPATPGLELANDTGANDGISMDGTVLVDNLEEGATWEYSLDGGTTWLLGEGESFVLPEGSYGLGQVQVRQSDAEGNNSEVGTLEAVIIDNDAPPAPTASLANNTGDVEGVSSDGTVNVGNLEQGATWEYSLDGGLSWLVGSINTFSLIEGSYATRQVLVRQSDGAGNTSNTNNLGAVIIDQTPPEAPTLALRTDTGNNDGVTADGTVLVGELEPNSFWEYSLDGGDTWQQGLGEQFVLPEGDYVTGQVQARQTDAAGNVSEVTGFGAVSVDLIIDNPNDPNLPDAPSLMLENNTGLVEGISSDGTVLVGNLEVGATWEYSLDGGATWLVGVGESFEVPEGDYVAGQILARQTDVDGNTSGARTLGSITIDMTAPEAPTVLLENNTGEQEGITADGTVVVGNLDPEAFWEYSLDGGNTWLRGIGDRFILEEADYVDGDVQVRQTDGAGNLSPVANLGPVTIDLTDPIAPTIALANDNGDVPGVTNDATVTVDDLEENATWEYSLDGGATWLEGEGDSFELPEAVYADGDIQVRQIDGAGNVGPVANLGPVTIDLTDPVAPTIALANDNGDVAGVTNDATVTVDDLEDNATWEYSLDGGATWLEGVGDSFELPEAVYADGDIQVRQTDGAGNVGPVANLGPVTIDLTDPVAPTIALANDNGDVAGVTNDATVTVDDLEENATWEYSLDGGATWLEGVGDSFELPEAVYADGDIQVRQIDGAGNVGPVANLGPVTIDLTDPVAPTIALANDNGDVAGVTNDATVTVDDLEENATWEYSLDGGATWLEGEGDSFELPEAVYADGDIQVRQTDGAGNVGPVANLGPVTIDLTDPVAPTIALANDNGDVAGVTNDATVTVDDLEEDATWEYSLDGGATWLEGEGDSFELPEAVYADGDIQVRQTDGAGNVGPVANLGPVTIDLTNPIAPTIALANDNGDVAGVTNDATVTVDDLEENATWEYSLDGGTTWLEGVGDSFELPEAVYADGDIQVRQTDGAGNLSPVADLGPVTIDLTDPVAPTIALANDNGDVAGVTNDATVTVDDLEENATWEYSLDGGATWLEGVGDSFELPEAVYADGDIQVRQTDGAGNVGPVANLGPVTIDLTSPGGEEGIDAPMLAIPLLMDGFINSEGVEAGFNAVVGLTENTQVGDTVTVELTIGGDIFNTDYIVTADDIETGSATVALEGDYPDGDYTAIAVISDQAGNVSADSNQLDFTLDTSAPDVDTTTITVDDLTADNVINIEEAAGQVTISGVVTGEYQPGDAVNITINGEVYDTTLGDGGTWSVPVLGSLLSGAEPPQVNVEVLATDVAGNVGSIEFTHGYTVDLDAPAITLDPINTINSVNIDDDLIITGSVSGVLEGAEVTVSIEGANYTGTVEAGVWSATVPAAFLAALEEGTLQVSASVADEAGNIGQSDIVEVLLDTQLPSVDITIADALLSADQTTTVTFEFSEAVENFSIDDITAVGGALSNLVSDDNVTWTATFTPGDESLDASIAIVGGAYSDAAGNPGQAGSLDGIVVDVDAPTVVGISAAVEGDLSSLETTEITIEFSEEITDLTVDDFVVSGGALSGLNSVDGITWTATFTPNGLATNASITLPDATYTDLAGNQGVGGALADLPIEILQPVLVIDAANDGFINGEEALGTEAQVGFEGLGVTAGQTITLTLVATADGENGVVAGDTITTVAYSVTAEDVANGFAVFDFEVEPEFANQPTAAQVSIEGITTPSEPVEFVIDTIPPGQAVEEGAEVQGNGIVLDTVLNPGDALRLRVGDDTDTVQVLDTDEYPGLVYQNGDGQTVLDLFVLAANLEELLGNDLESLLDLRALTLQLSTYDTAGNESDIITLNDLNILGPLVTVVDFTGSLVGVTEPGATLDVELTLAGTTQTISLVADENGEFSLDLLTDPRFSFSLEDLLAASVSIVATDAQGNSSYAPVEASLNELLPAPLSTADLTFITDIVTGPEGVVSSLSGIVLPEGSALDATLQVGGLGSVAVPLNTSPEGDIALDLNAALLSAVGSFDLLSGISGLFNGRGLGLTLEYTTPDGVVTTTSVELLGGSLAQLTFGEVDQILINGTDATDLLVVEAGQSVAAGAGDDLIVLRSDEFGSIDGGSGVNTLLLEGGVTLAIEAFERMSNIQRINLGDSASSVEINAEVAAALSGELDNLEIVGGAGDSVLITGAVTVGDPISLNGAVYQTYTLDGITLVVSDGVDVELTPSINESAGYIISGGAEAGSEVTVDVGGAVLTATADETGEWRLLLDTPLAAGSQVSAVVDGQTSNTVNVPDNLVAPSALQIRVPPLVGLLASFLEGSAVGAEQVRLDVFQDNLFTSLRSTTIDVNASGGFSVSSRLLTDLLNDVTGLLVGNQGVNVGFTAIAEDGSRSTTQVVEFGDAESIFQNPTGALTGLLGNVVGGLTGRIEALPVTESFYAGDDDADFVRGSSLAQTITTEDGNDVVISGGGADTIDTGAGDDVISIGSNAFVSIDGGDGFDVVMLESGFDLNMEAAGVGDINNIERVDLGQQNGANTFTLTGEQLIELTDEGNVLQITGDSQDSAELIGADWINSEQQQIIDGVVFNEYSYQGASLLVEDTISTNIEVA